MKPNVNYSLYLVTDRALMHTKTLEESVEQAVQGGCTVVQLREKDCDSRTFYEIAMKIKKATDRNHVPLIINDRLDIALAVDATGVHLGQSDLPAPIARRLLGEDKILGVSVSSLAEALQAEEDGADYLGVGAMFSTDTKTDASLVTMAELAAIRKSAHLPIVVIGGINLTTLSVFAGTGIDGIAVVSAVMAAKDICAAAKELIKAYSNL